VLCIVLVCVQKDGERMIANHIHDALDQVKTLRELILEKKHFRGYSGKARIVSGLAALAGAVVLSLPHFPSSPLLHLAGWGVVLVVGLLLNYVAVLYWFLFDHDVRRNPIMLKPAVDAIPALAAGAALSLALIMAGQYDLLTGVWMALYGLAQTAYRQSLPKGIYFVGLAYVICGAYFLVIPQPFVNPWPMGVVFCVGETAGGVILIRDRIADTGEDK
jgi:hypothetical protein